MVHEILHGMFEIKEGILFWGIHVSTKEYGEISNIIAILDSDVHEYTNPVIEWSSMWFLYLFQIFFNNICIHEECIFKWCIHWKRRLLEFYFIFFLCSPIFLNNIFHDVICLINNNSMLNLITVNVEDLYFCSFLEVIFKENIKIFC